MIWFEKHGERKWVYWFHQVCYPGDTISFTCSFRSVNEEMFHSFAVSIVRHIFTAGLEQFIDISRWKNLLTFQKQNIESINMILYGIISKSFIDWLNDYICSATGDDNSQNYGILGATTTWTSPSTHKFQYSRLSWSYISE